MDLSVGQKDLFCSGEWKINTNVADSGLRCRNGSIVDSSINKTQDDEMRKTNRHTGVFHDKRRKETLCLQKENAAVAATSQYI